LQERNGLTAEDVIHLPDVQEHAGSGVRGSRERDGEGKKRSDAGKGGLTGEIVGGKIRRGRGGMKAETDFAGKMMERWRHTGYFRREWRGWEIHS